MGGGREGSIEGKKEGGREGGREAEGSQVNITMVLTLEVYALCRSG